MQDRFFLLEELISSPDGLVHSVYDEVFHKDQRKAEKLYLSTNDIDFAIGIV